MMRRPASSTPSTSSSVALLKSRPWVAFLTQERQPPNFELSRGCLKATHDDRTDEFGPREPSTQQGPRQSEVLNVRKVVAYELLSLDGVAEKPDEFIADWDDAMGANLGAVIAAQDSVILG